MTEMPIVPTLHLACAGVYMVLGAAALLHSEVRRPAGWFFTACSVTAVWATASGLAWYLPVENLIAALAASGPVCWYMFALSLYSQSIGGRHQTRTILQPLVLTILVLLVGALLPRWGHSTTFRELAGLLEVAAHIGLSICGLLLLENLYRNTSSEARWNINLFCVGLGGMFAYDLILYANAILFRTPSATMEAARAPVMLLAAPLLAAGIMRYRRWFTGFQVSQDAAFHSFTLIACGVFLLAVALTGEGLSGYGAEWGRVGETILISAAVLLLLVLVTSGSARSHLRRMVVENFFRHRYDYRKEWIRCINTLTAPEAFVALHKRAIRAAADVVDSPAGALFINPPDSVGFHWAGSWNMPAALAPLPPGHPIIPLFRDNNWIVDIRQHADPAAWFPELPRAWIAVPLSHFGALIGFVVLARSRAHFKLDREAYDLLRVIGCEIASRVAEQRAEQLLNQTRQLRRYSQRFAFVIHDIKNVSGQLSMLLTNAEVHAADPDFQRDMLMTIGASVGKITRLLSKLQADDQERAHALITAGDRMPELVRTCQRMHQRQIRVSDHSRGAGVAMDPDAFDAVMTHLLDNAVDASDTGQVVSVNLRLSNGTLVIDIADRGCGMSDDFVRNELFRPLRTTKKNGLGIGAFQARELLREAGGDLLVISRPGHGTTMRLVLPCILADVAEPIGA